MNTNHATTQNSKKMTGAERQNDAEVKSNGT